MENARHFVVLSHAVLVSCFTGCGSVADLVSSLLANGIRITESEVVRLLRDSFIPLYSDDVGLVFQSCDVAAAVADINKTRTREGRPC